MLTDSDVTSDTPCQDFKPPCKTHESVLGTHGTGLDRESVLCTKLIRAFSSSVADFSSTYHHKLSRMR